MEEGIWWWIWGHKGVQKPGFLNFKFLQDPEKNWLEQRAKQNKILTITRWAYGLKRVCIPKLVQDCGQISFFKAWIETLHRQNGAHRSLIEIPWHKKFCMVSFLSNKQKTFVNPQNCEIMIGLMQTLTHSWLYFIYWMKS